MSETNATLIAAGLILGSLLLIAGIVVATNRAARRRREGMSKAARHLRLDFAERGSASLVAELSQYQLFSQGHRKRIRNICSGRPAEISTRLFDYQYTVGGGQHSNTWRQTVAVFESPHLNLPPFYARPEHFFHRVAEKFGKQDIDFEQDEEFSKKYLLRGDDEAAIRRVFTNAVRSHLANLDKTTVEGRGHQLLFYRQGKRVSPDALDDFLKEAVHVFALFKTATSP